MLLTLLVACNQNNSGENFEEPTSSTLVDEYNLVSYQKTVYEDYFKKTDNEIGFAALKPNSIQEVSLQTRIDYSDKEIEIEFNNGLLSKSESGIKLGVNEQNAIFGKQVSFSVFKKGNKGNTRAKIIEDDLEMYVPELVEILSPKIQTQEELFPVCYYDNFIIEWNADPNNKEGLVVIAEYFGNNAIPSNSEETTHVLNVDYIKEDTGKTVLNKELFKDIPDLSFAHIILLRGNVAIEEIEGKLYKFFAETHVRLPIILSKNLDNLKK